MLRHLSYGWRNFSKDPDVDLRRLNWEFFAVVKGRCAPHFFGQPLPSLKCSTLWLLPPKVPYRWVGWNRPCQRAMLQFATVSSLMQKMLEKRAFLEVSITPAQGERILQLAEQIRPFHYHPDETHELRTTHLISELCLMIVEGEQFHEDTPLHLVALKRVQRAEQFYRENVRRKPTLKEVAMEVDISESQLRRNFQQTRYAPPEEVFRTLRLHEACRLLLNTMLTNDLIADHAGFGSTVDFHRSFKAEFGVTPHYWRTHTKAKKEAGS